MTNSKSFAIVLLTMVFGTYYVHSLTAVKVGFDAVNSGYICAMGGQGLASAEGAEGDPLAARTLRAGQDRECVAAERGVKIAESMLPRP